MSPLTTPPDAGHNYIHISCAVVHALCLPHVECVKEDKKLAPTVKEADVTGVCLLHVSA